MEEVSCESRDPRLTFHHLSRRKPCKVTESRLPLQKNHSRDVLKYKLRNGADDVESPRERNNSRDKNTKESLAVSRYEGKRISLHDETQFGFLYASKGEALYLVLIIGIAIKLTECHYFIYIVYFRRVFFFSKNI